MFSYLYNSFSNYNDEESNSSSNSPINTQVNTQVNLPVNTLVNTPVNTHENPVSLSMIRLNSLNSMNTINTIPNHVFMNNHHDNIHEDINSDSEDEDKKILRINVEENEYLFNSILHYAIKFSKNRNLFDYETSYISKTKTYSINKKICNGKNYIVYKDINIIIEIFKSNIPLATADTTKYHNHMILNIPYNDNSDKAVKTQLFDEFCNEAMIYYKNKIKNQSKEKNKTSIYMWDEYWESADKRTSRSLDTVYLEGKEQKLKNKIVEFLDENTKNTYNEFGIPYKMNILLHGYPGTGKTSVIYALASELNKNVALLQFNATMTDAEFGRALRRLPADTFLVLEDIDVLFEVRKKNDEHAHNISFSGLLNALDGIGHIDSLVIFMTTNRLMVLDSALKRPGRIDLSLEFKYSSKNQIKTMFHKFLPKQKDTFNEFYKEVKNLKITSAGLQQFLFAHRLDENIIEHMDEFKDICSKNNYDETPSEHTYT